MSELWTHPTVAAALITSATVLLAAVLAVFKGGDLLKELRVRKIHRQRTRLQATCPHTVIVSDLLDHTKPRARSLFRPESDDVYRCVRCKICTLESEARRTQAVWLMAPPKELAGLIDLNKTVDAMVKELDALGNWYPE